MYVALQPMPIKKIAITEFIQSAIHGTILDVRSPGEYKHAQIPGALNLPLFTDEERKIVGTAYKQQGRQPAIKLGLDFFGVKMKSMVEAVEKIIADKDSAEGQQTKETLYVHCWRGGMRSAAVAWLLDMYGFDVCVLSGGYKAYRNWALEQFEKEYDFKIIGGYTGSGKTQLLQQLEQNNNAVIDLEGIAIHKGSAFGGIGLPEQPTQEMFENILALELNKNANGLFYIEDESQRIGRLNIPHSFWNTMRTKPVYFLEIPFNERLKFITQEYGVLDKEKIKEAILRIQKRLGPLETKMAIQHLEEDNYTECFDILLKYYDKLYLKGLNNRENIALLINKIECSAVDTISNMEKLQLCATVNI
jgi:tRNA 2-selenouridine synthase